MTTAQGITIALSAIGIILTIITVWTGLRKAAKESAATQAAVQAEAAAAQARMETKIEALTDEVRRHNNFAQRLPVVENDIKTIYHRLEQIEEAKK